MATPDQTSSGPVEPRGLGEHTRGLAGEYAHEQGWGLNIEERTRAPHTPQDTDGGNDYEYGARDFGDEPVNARRVDSEAQSESQVFNETQGSQNADKGDH